MKTPSESKSRRQNACTTLFVIAVALSMGAFTFMLIGPLSGPKYPAYTGQSLAAMLRKLETSSRTADFSEHHKYTSLDQKYDWLWEDDLLTPNGGYLTADKKTNNTDKLGLSMFHQLHCLGMIREEMQHLHHIIEASKTVDSGHIESHQIQRRHSDGVDLDAGRPAHHDQKHTMHCFDYLRQTILCQADSTVERPKQFDDGKPYIDGMGPRKCRNWDILYEASSNSDDEPMSDDELR